MSISFLSGAQIASLSATVFQQLTTTKIAQLTAAGWHRWEN